MALCVTLLATGCAIKGADAQSSASRRAIFGLVKPAGPYTPAVSAGGFLFLSGQVGREPSTNTLVPGGTKAETRQAMENLGKLLQEAGLGFGDVVKTTVFLADIKDLAEMNEVYASFFPAGGIPPARSTVQAVIPTGARVEIEMIAVAR